MRSSSLAAAGAALLVLAVAVAGCSRDPRHLVLITVDTLRADHLGSYGREIDLTPNLDRLAQRSVRFARAYAPMPFTMPSLAALMTGRHPDAIGVISNLAPLPDEVPTLAEELAARGWRTAAVVGSYVLLPDSRMYRGFEHYDARLPEQESVRFWVPERTAGPTTDAAIAVLEEKLSEGDAPLFLWVHYQDPHGPYSPPPGYRELFLPHERARRGGSRELPRAGAHGLGGIPRYQHAEPHGEVAWYRAGYDGEIRYLDTELGRLLEAIDGHEALAGALIVFTADHGEDLGERDHWFSHGEYLTEAVLHVPLLFRVPGRAPGVRGDFVTLLDVLPTIDALFGLELALPDEGRDLFARGADREQSTLIASTGQEAASAHRLAIVRDGYKLVRTSTGEVYEERIFRVPSDVEVGAAPSALVQSLREELEARAAGFPPRPPPPKLSLPPEQEEALRAMGYLD